MTEKNGDLGKFAIVTMRLLTPALGAITLFMLSLMWNEIHDISYRIYIHQTNHEIHIPRTEFVELRADIREQTRELKNLIQDIQKQQRGIQ